MHKAAQTLGAMAEQRNSAAQSLARSPDCFIPMALCRIRLRFSVELFPQLGLRLLKNLLLVLG